MNPCLRAALAYAERGWVPLPLNWTGPGGSCSCQRGADCGNPGKHPRVRWADRDHVAVGELRSWWRWWPAAGVGVRTGAVSGVVVLDVDPRHGGGESLAALEASHGALPATLTVETGGGGLHLYLAHPGFEIRNLQNDDGRRLGPGLDIRGDGGQAAAPPTLHASGRRYTWRDWTVPLAPMPAWLAERLRPAPPVPRRAVVLPSGARGRGYVEVAVEGEVRRVLTAAEGDRNNRLYQASRALGGLVGAGALEDWRAAQALLSAAESVGLRTGEAEATILSGLRRGVADPRVLVS